MCSLGCLGTLLTVLLKQLKLPPVSCSADLKSFADVFWGAHFPQRVCPAPWSFTNHRLNLIMMLYVDNKLIPSTNPLYNKLPASFVVMSHCRRFLPQHVPNLVTGIYTIGQRVIVSDVQESLFWVRYRRNENQLIIFADDTYPRWVTTACLLDYDTMASADKFGNISIVSPDVETRPPARRNTMSFFFSSSVVIALSWNSPSVFSLFLLVSFPSPDVSSRFSEPAVETPRFSSRCHGFQHLFALTKFKHFRPFPYIPTL